MQTENLPVSGRAPQRSGYSPFDDSYLRYHRREPRRQIEREEDYYSLDDFDDENPPIVGPTKPMAPKVS